MAPKTSNGKPKRVFNHRRANSSAKRSATKTGPSTTAAATDKPATRYVPHSSLAWSTVHVPTEAVSGGAGTTDSIFFQGFSFDDDDDFMGLQEIVDVDVEVQKTKDGGKTIRFKATEDNLKANKKAKRNQTEQHDVEAKEEESNDDDHEHEEEELTVPPPAASKKATKRKRVEQADEADDYVSPFGPEDDEVASEHHPDDDDDNNDDKEEELESGDDDPVSNDEEQDAAIEGEDDQETSEFAEEDENEDEMEDDDLAVAFSKAQSAGLALDDDEDNADDDDDGDGEFDESLLPGWSAISLHPELKRALYNMKFAKPTNIQARSLPPALGLPRVGSDSEDEDEDESGSDDKDDGREVPTVGVKKDVVGISQTGSGKTLAYGLPILQRLFHNAPGSIPMPAVTAREGDDSDDDDSLPPPLGALIITPTRELALQVATHLSDVIKASCRRSPSNDHISKRKLSQRPHIAVVCGGMSEQKQRRMLEGRSRSSGGADIIVATPGRLWEMARLDDHLAARIKRTRFLVLDEADRMVEVGHFAEMEHILKLVSRDAAEAPEDDAEGFAADDGGDDDGLTLGIRPSENMQTFVFSATLSKALQTNLQKRKRLSAKSFTKRRNGGGKGKAAEATTLDELMERIDFRDERPTILDLTSGQGLPEGLVETKVECLHTDKDLYLYYFLLRYPGRTLVFVNSIDGIRRLQPILANLRINVFPLHSQLQQKQRLKSLDRFRATQLSRAVSANQKMTAATHDANNANLGGSSSVLLATDVAARGLDIPAVDHVVHYQLPRSADSYVHRSGRTARAGGAGVALALIEPKEKKLWASLCRTLKRPDTLSLPILYSLLPALKARLALSRELDQKRHKTSKASHEDSWLRTLANEVELDFHNGDTDSDGEGGGKAGAESGKGRKAKIYSAQVKDLEGQLEMLLRQPLKQRGTSRKYITTADIAGTRGSLASQLVGDGHHETVLGLDQSTAQTDLSTLSSRRPGASKKQKTKSKPAPRTVIAAAPDVEETTTKMTTKITTTTTDKKSVTLKQKRRAKQLAREVLKMKRKKQ